MHWESQVLKQVLNLSAASPPTTVKKNAEKLFQYWFWTSIYWKRKNHIFKSVKFKHDKMFNYRYINKRLFYDLILAVWLDWIVSCNSPPVEAGVGAAQMGRFRLRNIGFT